MPNTRSILVVDDEETDRSVILNTLQREGFRVIASETYEEALAAANSDASIFFLVADVALPDGNGCALALTLKQKFPKLKVLFVSGHVGSQACRYYGLDVTDTHFLRKPFSSAELIARVHAVIESSKPFPEMYFKPSGAGF